MEERNQLVASGFVNYNGKYLLVQCKKFHDWRVPGGRNIPRERSEDTLKREMKEELSVDITDVKFIGYGQDFRIIEKKDLSLSRTVLYFSCKCNTTPIFDPSEIEDTKWLTIEEIKNHPNIENAMVDLFSRTYDF